MRWTTFLCGILGMIEGEMNMRMDYVSAVFLVKKDFCCSSLNLSKHVGLTRRRDVECFGVHPHVTMCLAPSTEMAEGQVERKSKSTSGIFPSPHPLHSHSLGYLDLSCAATISRYIAHCHSFLYIIPPSIPAFQFLDLRRLIAYLRELRGLTKQALSHLPHRNTKKSHRTLHSHVV